MSTIDTSTWNPDADLNTAIEGIPLNADAGIAQTWQALRVLMAAVKGDGDAIKSMIDVMQGATASADGASGLVPAPEAGDENKVLKGDGTWGALSASDIPNIDASKIASGTIDLARLPAGALERLVTVADQTARFALTTASVQLGDTVKQLDTGVMYIVVDTTKLGQATGYVEYTAGTAASVPWTGVTGKPSTFTPSSHAHGNLTNDGKLGTASRVVVTDGDKKIDVSSVTATELGHLSGVTSAVQTQLDAKAADSAVVHLASANAVSATDFIHKTADNSYLNISGGSLDKAGAYLTLRGPSATSAGYFGLHAKNSTADVSLVGRPNGTLTWDNGDITGDVHSSGAETITGEKTFSSCILTTSNATLRHTKAAGFVQIGFAPVANGPRMNLFGKSYSGTPGLVQLIAYDGSSAKNFHASPDGTLTWDGQAIQTASDERLKTPLSAVPDAVIDAWGDVQWGQFQFLDAVSAKGESARLHLGLIAQRVKAVFKARGLDACQYGILCHEVHPAKPAVFDEHGEMLFPAEDAVDLWTVRYTEALAMETSYQRRRADRLEKRLADLEARLTAMEVANV